MYWLLSVILACVQANALALLIWRNRRDILQSGRPKVEAGAQYGKLSQQLKS